MRGHKPRTALIHVKTGVVYDEGLQSRQVSPALTAAALVCEETPTLTDCHITKQSDHEIEGAVVVKV